MLQGLTSFTNAQNSRVEEKLSQTQERFVRSPSKNNWRMVQASVFLMAKAGKLPMRPEHLKSRPPADPEELAREMEDVSASIAQLRKRHETFQPMSPDQAARQKLFGAPQESEEKGGRSQASRLPADRLSPEERRERFELLKFVRKIEPDLPPLERSPPPKGPPPNQALVEFNASSTALQRWRPDNRSRIVAESAAERMQHVSRVVRNALEVKAAARARRRELAELRAGGLAGQNALADLPEAAGQWLVITVVANFLQTALTELRLHKLAEKERCDYVMKHFERLKRKRVPQSSLTGELVSYVKLTMMDDFQKRVPLLSTFFVARVGIKRHRKEARKVLTCLQAWRSSGPTILQLKRIGVFVRRIQRWWRERADWLQQMHNAVSLMWLTAEHGVLEGELRDMLSWCTHDEREEFEARIDKSRLPSAVRSRFIENEMRARRYLLLPRIYIYEEECARWRVQLQEWRETREALVLMTNGEHPELPVFNWAPVEPTYMPNEEEVMDMFLRARSRPLGWTPIPQYNKSCKLLARKPSKDLTREGDVGPEALADRPRSRSRSIMQLAGRPAPGSVAEDEDEAWLRRLGISAAHMPGGLARPPPPTNECEDD